MQLFLLVLAVLTFALAVQAKVYVHMMPWFENKASNGGKWGLHWTMSNKNPDHKVNGQADVASFYHPLIGPYASGDKKTIDWQMGVMKTSGISGIFLDWPGTSNFADYHKNLQNAEAIIAGVERAGLEFAIVYEDNNLNLEHAGDKVAQAIKDIRYCHDHYFNKPHYVKVNGQPLILDFGPQALTAAQVDKVFDAINPKPTYVPLWYHNGGKHAKGQFAWPAQDFTNGLNHWYNDIKAAVKIGVAYPGFNAFYKNGGWGDIPWKISVSLATFKKTLDLAVSKTHALIQVATWNDYGEGTMIEPTHEFNYQFTNYIRTKTAVKFTQEDTEEVTRIFMLRQEHADNTTMTLALEQQHHELIHKFDE